jgi:hypothetical protein
MEVTRMDVTRTEVTRMAPGVLSNMHSPDWDSVRRVCLSLSESVLAWSSSHLDPCHPDIECRTYDIEDFDIVCSFDIHSISTSCIVDIEY